MLSRICDSVYTIQYLDFVEDWDSIDWNNSESVDEIPIRAANENDVWERYPCIIDETQNITYFKEPYGTQTHGISMSFYEMHDENGELINGPVRVIAYCPNIDRQTYSSLFEELDEMSDKYRFDDLGFYLVLDSGREDYQFTVRSNGAWYDESGLAHSNVFNLTELVSKHMDLDAMQQEVLKKYKEFNQNLQKEFGLTAEEILALK